MHDLNEWLNGHDIFLGFAAGELLIALGVALASWIVMMGALRFALSRLRQFAERTSTTMDDVLLQVLAGTNRWLVLLAAVLLGLGTLEVSEHWRGRVTQLWFVAVAFQIGLWGTRAAAIAVKGYEQRHNGGRSQLSAAATLMSWGLRTVLWAVVLLAVLSNMGVNITAFVASLGVGGVAVALAVQNILGDLFASLSIAVDKPFEVGDFIGTTAGVGTVLHVGLKTTRIRALSGEELVIGNTDLLKQPLKNYRRMLERRIVFRFGVTYDTPPAQVEAIPGIVRQVAERNERIRFDRAHFVAFGDSSLDFEVVYNVLDADYGLYMDAQQQINLGLLREFAAAGIEFAFPTRTVYVARTEDASVAAAAAAD